MKNLNKFIMMCSILSMCSFLPTKVFAAPTDISIEQPTENPDSETTEFTETTETNALDGNNPLWKLAEEDGYTEVGTEYDFGKLVYKDDKVHVFYDSENDEYISYENLSMSNEELNAIGITTYPDGRPLKQEIYTHIPSVDTQGIEKRETDINFNVKTVFDNFDINDSMIADAQISITGEKNYIGEEEFESDYGKLYMTDQNDFQINKTIHIKDNKIVVFANIPSDRLNAYSISINDTGKDIAEFDTNNANINLTLHIKQKENAVKDVNEIETKPVLKEIEDGSYGQKKRVENGLDEATPSEITVSNNQDKNVLPFVLIGGIIILLLGGVVYVIKLRKDMNADDEDDDE